MRRIALALAALLLVPAAAWAHGGGVDKHGCHKDAKVGDYHCHEGKLKGRTYKSEDTMLTAHPELRSGEAAKKEKAVDKVKDGDRKTTDDHLKESKAKK